MKRSLRFSLLLVLFLSGIVKGQTWDWSEPKEHHKSIVIVRSSERNTENSGGAFGSGVYIQYKNMFGVLTARHTLRNRYTRITDHLGHITNACQSVIKDTPQNDLAFIKYYNKNLTPLEIAENKPTLDKKYEFVGWGGPGVGERNQTNSLRHFWSVCKSSKVRNRNEFTGSVTLGDSGGPVLTEDHKVAGIILEGWGNLQRNNWPYSKDSQTCYYSTMVAFLDSLAPQKVMQGYG